MRIQIINGPNLNLLGKREVSVYGNISFDDYLQYLRKEFENNEIQYYQSNVEGEIINCIQEKGCEMDGIVLNAGGYTHTSIAIRDAILSVPAKVVEVHITNIYKREEFRHISLLGSACTGTISGFGLVSYELGIYALLANQSQE